MFSAQKVEQILALANRSRSTSKTSMNEQSSRSHSIFTLTLQALHLEKGTKLHGSLNL